MSSVTQHQHETPEGADLSDEEVTVTDSHHPLFGCTFPLVRMFGEDGAKRSCVVRLPSGVERLVPIEATDRSPNQIEADPLPLSMAGISRLLEAHERIKRQTNETQELPHAPESSGGRAKVKASKRDSAEQKGQENQPPDDQYAPVPPEAASPRASHMASLERPRAEEPPADGRQAMGGAAGVTRELEPQPGADRLIKLGDVAQYLGVSQGMVTRFVVTGAIKTVTNPLDMRLKLVSTRELDEFKRWLTEMERERDEAMGRK